MAFSRWTFLSMTSLLFDLVSSSAVPRYTNSTRLNTLPSPSFASSSDLPNTRPTAVLNTNESVAFQLASISAISAPLSQPILLTLAKSENTSSSATSASAKTLQIGIASSSSPSIDHTNHAPQPSPGHSESTAVVSPPKDTSTHHTSARSSPWSPSEKLISSTTKPATSRIRSTLHITPKPSSIYRSVETKVGTDANHNVTTRNTASAACYEWLPEVSMLAWQEPVVLRGFNAPIWSATNAIWYSTDSAWNGSGDIAQHTTPITILYPTTIWDYAYSYSWEGSSRGAVKTCKPDDHSVSPCSGTVTFSSHPPYSAIPTSVSAVDMDNPLGIGLFPTWIAVTADSDQLEYFRTAFPDASLFDECTMTTYDNHAHIAPPVVQESATVAAVPSVAADPTTDVSTSTQTVEASIVIQPTNAIPLLTANTDGSGSVASTYVAESHGVATSAGPSTTVSDADTAATSNAPETTPMTPVVPSNALEALTAAIGVVSDQSPPLPATITFAGETLVPSSGNFVVQSQTVAPGSPVTVTGRSSTVVIALSVDSNTATRLQVGDSVTALATPTLRSSTEAFDILATVTALGQVVTQIGDQVMIQGQSIKPGSSVTLGSGSQTTVVAVNIGASGTLVLVIGSATATLLAAQITPVPERLPIPATTAIRGSGSLLPNIITFQGQTITFDGAEAFVQGQSIGLDSVVTIGSGTGKMLVTLTTDAAHQTELIVDGSTTTLPIPKIPLNVGGLTIVPTKSNAVLVDGQLLSVGATITVGEGDETTRVILSSLSNGQMELIEPSTTIFLNDTAATAASSMSHAPGKPSATVGGSKLTVVSTGDIAAATSDPTSHAQKVAASLTVWCGLTVCLAVLVCTLL